MTATAVSINAHFFEVLQNNEHPSFTIYDDDPIAGSYAPYCMINNFEISCNVAEYMKFSADFIGKQMQTASAQTPAYASENPFTASMAGVRFASNEAGLDSASEQCVQSFRIAVSKNL
jgi:hypothetical protein